MIYLTLIDPDCPREPNVEQEMPLETCRVSLMPRSAGWLRVLRIGLLLSSIGWGISFLFTFCSWEVAADQLYLMGADPIEYQPLLDYWLKMASATFGCIGIASGMACARPVLFEGLVWLLAPFHGFVGAALVIAAISNHLDSDRHPTFVADITFCFVTALLISVPLMVGFFNRKSEGEPSLDPRR